MQQNSRNHLFRSKQTTNKVPPNIFRFFEVRTRVRLMIWRPNHSMKVNSDILRCYKQIVKVCLVYLEWKLQQDRYGHCNYKFKCHKTVQRRYLVTSKQQRWYRWCFYTLKWLGKGNNGSFRRCKQTSKVQSLYFTFESLKIRSKSSQQSSKIQKQSTNDVFGCYNAKSHVRMTSLEVEMRELVSS